MPLQISDQTFPVCQQNLHEGEAETSVPREPRQGQEERPPRPGQHGVHHLWYLRQEGEQQVRAGRASEDAHRGEALQVRRGE